MAQSMSKKITIDFEAGKSLNNILKTIQGVGENAKEIKIDDATIKQLNSVTHKIEALEKKIEEVEKSSISTQQFKAFSDSIISLIGEINTQFDSLYANIQKTLDPSVLSQFEGAVRTIQVDTQKTTGQIIAGLSNVEDMVENIVNDEKVGSAKINAMTKQVVSEQVAGAKKKADAEKQVTKEIQKQEDAQKKVNREKDKSISKTGKKYKTDPQADEFVKVDFQLPDDAEQNLKDTVASIVNSINATNPTVEVRVAFVSNYKTRRRQEIIEQLNKDLDKVYQFPPKTKKKQEEFYGIVEDARAQFMKELSKDSLSLDFETNIKKLREEIPMTMQELKKALGEIELDANVKISKQQVEEQLGELQNFTLTINDVAFSPDFLTKIDGLSSLLEEQEKQAKEAQPDTAADKGQIQKLADLISQAKKVNELINSIGEHIGAIPLKGQFDKDQLQESLNSISGLTLKIAELDVGNIQGIATGGGVIVGGIPGNGVYTGGTPISSPSNAESTKTNEQIADNEEKVAHTLEDFVKAVDEFAKFNLKKDSKEFKSDKAIDTFVNKFISGDMARKYGYNLSDWIANTTKLGEGSNKTYNAKLIEDKYGNRAPSMRVNVPDDSARKADKKLQEALANAKVNNDKLDMLNTEVRNYVKMLGVPLDQLGKTLQERLDEVETVDDYLKLGKDYSKQQKVKEERKERLDSIMMTLSTMPQGEYNNMMMAGANGQYADLWGFIKELQANSPDIWEKVEKRRNDVVAEEIKRLIGKIEKDKEGNFLQSEKNTEALDSLASYLFGAKLYGSQKGPASWAAISRNNNISRKDMESIKGAYKETEPFGYLEILSQRIPTLKTTDKDIETFAEELHLSAEMTEKIKQALKKTIDDYNEAMSQNDQEEKKEEPKPKKKVRAKTVGEMSKASEEKSAPAETKPKPAETKPKEVERRVGYDSIFSDLQLLVQQVGMPVDLGLTPKEDSVEEIDKQLSVYYEKLAKIEELRNKIDEFKSKVKAETGKELTDEQVFQEIFPASPENAKTGLRDLQKYEEFYNEAQRLVDKQKELAAAKKSLPKQQETPEKLFDFNEQQIEAIETLAGRLTLDERGNIAKGKDNTTALSEITKSINSFVKTEKGSKFDINNIRDKINVPGIEKFTNALREERRNNRALQEEFDKLTYQMSKLNEESEEYKALSSNQADVRKRLDESTSKMNDIQSAKNAYSDAFFENINTAYKKKYEKAGKDAIEGYNEGAESKKAETERTTADVMRAGIDAAKKEQKSHSPSKEYYQLGVWAIEGYLDAIKENLSKVKEGASMIKLNPDGSLDASKENMDLVEKFKNRLTEYGVTNAEFVNPMSELQSLWGNLGVTGSGNVSAAKGNYNNLDAFFAKYISSFNTYDKNTFNEVLNILKATDNDKKTMWSQFKRFREERHARSNEELKALIGNLETNADNKTISKTKNKDAQAALDLFNKYRESRVNAENKDVYDRFAKEMGLNKENTKRLWEIFQDLFVKNKENIERLRQQCLDAVNDVQKAEENAEAETTQEELKNVEKVKEANTDAVKAEEKERQKVIKQIDNIVKKTKYMSSFRQEGRDIINDLNNGAPLGVGQDYIDRAPNPYNQVGSNSYYYDILKRANRLSSSNIANSDIKSQASSIADALQQLGPEAEKSYGALKKLDDEMSSLEAEAEKAGKTFVSEVVNRLKKANADFFARYLSIRDIIRYFNTLRQTVTEYDTALTEMRKVSDETTKSLREYQQETFKVAGTLGTTALQLQQTTADWLRLGESMDEAKESAKVATTLLNVSEFENINEATTALVAMSQAYKDMDKTEIIDVLNNIGNNYSIATDQLATALQASSSALMTQGNNLYEAAALVTAGNAVIQDASKVGTGIRTISLRIAGEKLGKDELKKELEELGEEVDDWVVQTEAKKRQVIMEYTRVASNNGEGVDILDPNGNLKNTYQIMLEISKIYKEIQAEDKKYGTNRAQALVEELAGKVRSNIAASILMNPQLLENVYNSAINSAGSAAEENAKYLDSIVGRTEQLKNSWQELQTSILNSTLLKDLLSLAKGFLTLVNALLRALPALPGILAAVAAGIFGINKQLFITKEQTLGVIPSLIKAVIVYLKSLIGAETAQAAAAAGAATATNALNAALTMGASVIIMGVIFGISKLIQREQTLATAVQEARDSIKSLNADLQNTVQTVDEAGGKYAEMAQKVANLGKINQSQGSLSNDEYKEFLEISDQLAQVFPTLTQSYDENGHAILNLNGSVATITNSLKELVKTQQQLAAASMLENAKTIFKDDADKYRDAVKAMTKQQKEFDAQQAIFDAIMSNSADDIDYNEMSKFFDNAFPDMLGSTLDKYMREYVDRGMTFRVYDFSELSAQDKKAIEQYFDEIRYDYIRETKELEQDIAQTNADFHTYMNYYATTAIDDDLTRQIVSGIINSTNYEDLSDEQRKDWDLMTKWLQTDIVSSIEAIDDNEIKDAMNDVLNGSFESLGDRTNAISSLLEQLKEQLGSNFETDPLVVWFKLQQTDSDNTIQQGAEHILGGLVNQNETQSQLHKRAEDYIKQLSSDEYKLLMNTSIPEGTINSLEDIYSLLQDVDGQSKVTYADINALLSQDNPIFERDRERWNPDEAEELKKILETERKKAERDNVDIERTVYGNLDFNKRGRLDIDEDVLKKYRKEFESWEMRGLTEARGEEFARAFEKWKGLHLSDEQAAKMAERDAEIYTKQFIESAQETVDEHLGTTMTVYGSYDEQAFGGIKIAYTPLLEDNGKLIPLHQDTIKKYFKELENRIKAEGLEVNAENILKFDAKGLEVDGRKVQKIIADVGKTAEQTSISMHYAGPNGSFGLLQEEIDAVEYNAPTWKQVREDLVGMAQSGKLDEKSLRNYKYFDEILQALGKSADITDEELKTMIEDINKISAINPVDRLSNAKTNYDKLDAGYKEYKAGKGVSATSLNEIQDSFAYLGEVYRDFEEAVMTGVEDLQPYFDQIVTEYAKQEMLMGSLDESTRKWTEDNLVAAGVTRKSAEESTKAILEHKKVVEASYLDDAKMLNTYVDLDDETRQLIINANDLSDLDAEAIETLTTEIMQQEGLSSQLKQSAQDLALYTAYKAMANGADLNNPADFAYLSALITSAGLASDALLNLAKSKEVAMSLDAKQTELEDFYKSNGTNYGKYDNSLRIKEANLKREISRLQKQADDLSAQSSKDAEKVKQDVANAYAKADPDSVTKLAYGGAVDASGKGAEDALKKAKETLEKILALYDAELDAGVIAFQEYVNKSRAIIEQYYREGKITAADYYDYLSSFYEKQVKEYDRVIQAVQELIQEQIEELEKQKESIEESYNLQIEEIQKKIETLQEENDEIDKNIALQKAQ